MGGGIMWSHPVRLFANKERNGSYTGRNHSPLARSRILDRRRMRRQTSPAHRASQAELVQPLRIVIGNAPCQDLPLPCIGRDFESLKLTHHFQRGPLTLNLCSWSHVLPAEQPAHKLRPRYGLDLLSQRGDRESMDSRQQTPLAPLDLRFVSRGRPRPCRLIGELTTQDCATSFHA